MMMIPKCHVPSSSSCMLMDLCYDGILHELYNISLYPGGTLFLFYYVFGSNLLFNPLKIFARMFCKCNECILITNILFFK